ncbi:hypothetical protein L6164_003226 [Bauhinia variegata]|uniref:Uncharacterized protein n=1 Tax=Bauhinia variegata TaxID=167791 RepID=A0ACB9Q0N9_BAUVA|nr:hypothetical protein L6164_003226 [Bauhinia variegata]
MPAVETSRKLAGLTLDDILANQKREAEPSQPCEPSQRTLIDVIREDESIKKDKKTWKTFKDKLRLKRAGSAWTSSIHIPASDIPIPRHSKSIIRSQLSHRKTVRPANSAMSTHPMDSHHVGDLDPTDPDLGIIARPQFGRGVSSRYEGDPTENKLKPSMSRRNSTRMVSRTESSRRERAVTFREPYDSDEGGSSDDDDEQDLRDPLRGVRTLSAREAVAAQEAAEAAAAAAAEEEAEEAGEGDNAAEPVKMSLMDLLEETDRQMGLEGSRYTFGDDWDEYEDEEEEESEEEEEGGVEYTCCVCMVKHRGSAFIPCGHTFCRLCSKELWVSRGHCPLCNNFVVEILDVF